MRVYGDRILEAVRSFRCIVLILSACPVCAAMLAVLSPAAERRRTRTLRHRARGLCLSLPRPPAAAGQRRRTGADGLYGRRSRAAERPHRGAAARPQFSVELLGAGHQDLERSRLSRGRAGPDRLRQILQAASRAAFRYAGAQHDRAARSSRSSQGRHRGAFARRHARGADRARLSGPGRASGADRADRAGGLPALRAADADREDSWKTRTS